MGCQSEEVGESESCLQEVNTNRVALSLFGANIGLLFPFVVRSFTNCSYSDPDCFFFFFYNLNKEQFSLLWFVILLPLL